MILRRSRARETALQLLYQHDLNPDVGLDDVREYVRERLAEEDDLQEFCWSLFLGTVEHRAQIDARISGVAQNWSLKRMAAIDRNVLRLGAYELLFTDTPPRVAINESLELAKRYGSAQSSQFVNGILDRLIIRGDPDAGPKYAAMYPDATEHERKGQRP